MGLSARFMDCLLCHVLWAWLNVGSPDNPWGRVCVPCGLSGDLVCGCSGGVLLFRSLVGAVPLALGGLASGFGMVPGVSLPRCGRRDGGGLVRGWAAPPLLWGWVGWFWAA